MWICLNNFVVRESRECEQAKPAWQIHVKAKMRSSWWEKKGTLESVASLLPFLPDAEAAAHMPYSSASMPSDPIPLCCLLYHLATPAEFFRWLHPKRPASCYWCWDGKSACLHCFMLRPFSHAWQKPQCFPLSSLSPLPAPSLLCLWWEQLMPPHTAERAGWCAEDGRKTSRVLWLAPAWCPCVFSSKDLKHKEVWWVLRVLHPMGESASLCPAGLGRGRGCCTWHSDWRPGLPRLLGVPAGTAHCKVFLPGIPQESAPLCCAVGTCWLNAHHLCGARGPGPLCPSVPPICQSADLCMHKQPFARDFQRPEYQGQVVKILTFPPGNLSGQ